MNAVRVVLAAILISSFNPGCTSPYDRCTYPDSYIKGMNIFFKMSRNRFEAADFAESLGRLKADGVNTLYLVPFFFSIDASSDQIDSSSETIPDSSLVKAISMAHENGFSVALKPHIDLENGVPRYSISPRNYSEWIRNYQAFINHYLTIAIDKGVHDFVVGTELDTVAEHPEFYRLCDSIRANCPLRLIYAASYNHFVETRLWDHVDVMGVDAYFNLDNNVPPSANTMHETWNYWLNLLSQFSALKGKPMIFTEVGYMSRSAVAQNPGTWSGNPPADCEVQKRCYEALLSQAGKFDRIIGICWWQWELGKIGGLDNNDATPRDKPAEEIIRSYWAP